MNRYLVVGLLTGMVHFGLFAHDKYLSACDIQEFEYIIACTPKITNAEGYYAHYQDNVVTQEWYYSSPLSLQLIKGDVNSFLDSGKMTSESEWFGAVLDALNLRYLNLPRSSFDMQNWLQNNCNYYEYNTVRKSADAHVVQLYLQTKKFVSSPSSYINGHLTYLKKCLIKRIYNIQYQLKHQRRFDYTYVGYALTSLVASGLSAYWSYYEYSKIAAFPAFCDMLKQRGITIKTERRYPYVYTIPYFPDDSDDVENEALFKKYLDLKKANKNGYGTPIVAGFMSVGLTYLAKELFLCACNPNFDNEYLPKYKKLLQFIIYLEKNGYDDWQMETFKQRSR